MALGLGASGFHFLEFMVRAATGSLGWWKAFRL